LDSLEWTSCYCSGSPIDRTSLQDEIYFRQAHSYGAIFDLPGVVEHMPGQRRTKYGAVQRRPPRGHALEVHPNGGVQKLKDGLPLVPHDLIR